MRPFPKRPLACAAAAALAVLVSALAPAAAQDAAPRPREDGLIGRTMQAVRDDAWAPARGMAAEIGPVAEDIVRWRALRAGEGAWSDYADFLARRSDWPGMARLHQAGEAAIAEGAPPEAVLAYFDDRPPQTATGARALIDAFEATGAADAARSEAVRVWRAGMTFPEEGEAGLLERYGAALAEHHEERLDALLWAGHEISAERMLDRVDAGWRRLGRARIALAARRPGVDPLVAAVPDALADDPGLAYARFDWRIAAGNYDSAADWLIERSASAESLGRPARWAGWRAVLARRDLRADDPGRAYRLASSHHLGDGARFADLEWLAGYIALRHLDDPATALGHFRALRVRVGSPISLGRAGYWEGRAHEAMDDTESARAAYAYAAEYQTGYYGQLAAERAGLPMDPALAGTEPLPDWRGQPFAEGDLFRAARLLRAAGGEWYEARRFILHLAGGLEDEQLRALAGWMLENDEPNWALNLAKDAVARGEEIVMPAYFPLTDLATQELPVPAPFALAIARRESEFDHRVVSPADARGLMQILPGTGELVARRLGVEFDEARLTADAGYNARLGATYLAGLIEEFDGATALVAAGYNAGPGRPRRWIGEIGDPREPDVDVVDWVESVPFSETRNYIMRVMEAVEVYRARLAGRPVAFNLRDELRGR